MKRGEIWTVAGGGYAGKPRPVVIVQDDRFAETISITICSLTTNPTEAPFLRVPIEASPSNGLKHHSQLMIDKITTVPRMKLGTQIGRLTSDDVLRMNRAIIVFLGIVGRRPRP